MKSIKNQKIKSIVKSDEEKYASILKTNVGIENLSSEDIKNIEHFYIYLSLLGAMGMLNEDAKFVALEEIKSYVGCNEYSSDVKKAFLVKYMELLEYRKNMNDNVIVVEDQDSILKLA